MMRLSCLAVLLVWVSAIAPASVLAKGQYMSRDEFITAAFSGVAPEKKVLWLTADTKQVASKILNRPYAGLRLRYLALDGRTAWVFEEIGKELPITMGFVVTQQQIEQIHILTYRESRGWEVRYPAFRRQFYGAQLDDKRKLSHSIDGITGATLSVNAVKRAARLALYLHALVTPANASAADTSKHESQKNPNP